MSTLRKATFPIAKDEAGNPVEICLVGGKVPVTSVEPGTCISARGTADLTETANTPDTVILASVAITAEKEYCTLEFHLQSNADAIWDIVKVDDFGGTPVDTLLHQVLTGPAKSECCHLDCLKFNTTGGTGTQQFEARARLIDYKDADACAIAFIATNEQP